MENTKNEEKKSKKSKWLILLLLLIILLLVVFIVFLLKDKNKDEEKLPEKNVIVNEGDFKDIDDFINSPKTPAGRYTVTMNSTWNFQNGKSASKDAYLENDRSNNNSVYFDLITEDTNDVILSSPIIPVGSHMDKITLDKELERGTYECICVYHMLDENNDTISTVNMGVTVNILS